jgi:predicted XRE-type DNA-binding protein
MQLTTQDVLDIKHLIRTRRNTMQEIADLFDISVSDVMDIKEGNTYTDIGGYVDWVGPPTKDKRPYKLTEIDVIKIKRLIREGLHKQVEIAKMFGVKTAEINAIKSGLCYQQVGGDVSDAPNFYQRRASYITWFAENTSMPHEEIADLFDVTVSSVSRIKYNRYKAAYPKPYEDYIPEEIVSAETNA